MSLPNVTTFMGKLDNLPRYVLNDQSWENLDILPRYILGDDSLGSQITFLGTCLIITLRRSQTTFPGMGSLSVPDETPLSATQVYRVSQMTCLVTISISMSF